MKKLFTSLVAVVTCITAHGASVITNPSPAVSNKPVEVTVTGVDLGSDVYCYTWCVFADNSGLKEKPACPWSDTNVPKYKMTRSNGNYTYTITNIQQFYSLTNSQLDQLVKIGFIAKNGNGAQTDDLLFEVVQGRRDAYSGGEGTVDSPFILKTPADLTALAATPSDWSADCYFRMEADINASGLSSSIGTASTPFEANFDGNGHSVTQLNLSSSTMGSATGLFGDVKGGTVSNLGVVKGKVKGSTYVGMLVGLLESGVIERCFTTGSVTGSSICVGGLVGENIAGQIKDCYSGAVVENANDYATGGLIGKNGGTVKNTYAAGEVLGHDYVGGLVGANYGTVSNSVALNKAITAPHDFVARFGGNNNARNLGNGNLSWEGMGTGRGMWTAHGDHAGVTNGDYLKDKDSFEETTGWDFDNVWEWRTDMNKEYPALQNLDNQRTPLSEEYYIEDTGIAALASESGIAAGPNPTNGPVYITAPAGVAEYAVATLDGALIARGSGNGAPEVSVDLSSAAAGLYLLNVKDADGRGSVFKIIKK